MASSTIQNNEEFQLSAQHTVNGNSSSPDSNPWISSPSSSRSTTVTVPSSRSYTPGNNGIRQPTVNGTDGGGRGSGAVSSQSGQNPGYTILVPANVRYRGVNMQLDLKLDQKTLAAAETLSRAVQDAVAAGRGMSDSTVSTAGTNGLNSHEPARPSSGNSTGPQMFENVVSQASSTQALFQESTGLSCLDSDTDNVPDALIDSGKLGESLLAKTGGRNPRDMLTEKIKSAIRQQKKPSMVLPGGTVSTSQSSYSLPSSPAVGGLSGSHFNDNFGLNLPPPMTTNSRLIQRPSLSSPTALTAGVANFSPLVGTVSLSGPSTPLDGLLSSSVMPEMLTSHCRTNASVSSLLIGNDQSEPELTSSELDLIINGGSISVEDLIKKKPVVTPPKCGGSKKSKEPAPFCHFSLADKACRQRSIVNFKFCIRHILNDPSSPYKSCAHMRKGGVNKPDIQCTNAIRLDKGEEFCSTHLIAMGRMLPKKRASKEANNSVSVQPTTKSKKGSGKATESKNGAALDTAPSHLPPQSPINGNGPGATHYPTNNNSSLPPNDLYHQQQQHFGANQSPAGLSGPQQHWQGSYPGQGLPPNSSGPFPSPGAPYQQQAGVYQHQHQTPQSPSFGSYGNSQVAAPGHGPQQASPFVSAASPFHGGYAHGGMTNGYGGYSPQTPGPGSAGFVYPSSSSATPFDLASHPSTPGRPGSNLSQHGPYGAPSTPGSPWKQPIVPPRGSSTDLMRTHPELASKLVSSGGEENGGLAQSLEDSNQGPLFQGSNPYMVSSSNQNSLDTFGMLNISPTSSSTNMGGPAPLSRQVSGPRSVGVTAGTPLGPQQGAGPLLFPSPVPSDRSVESQLSAQTVTPISGSQSIHGVSFSSTNQNSSVANVGGLGSSLPPLFGTPSASGGIPGSSFFGESTSTNGSDYLPQGAISMSSNSSQNTGGYLSSNNLNNSSMIGVPNNQLLNGGNSSNVGQSGGGWKSSTEIMHQFSDMDPGHFGANPTLMMAGVQMTPNMNTRPSSMVGGAPGDSAMSTPVGGTSKKVIRLQQKKRRGRMNGRYYRRIPALDHMCRLMEDYDFDKDDLFPLGLEPSSSDTDGEDEAESVTNGDACFLSRLLSHAGVEPTETQENHLGSFSDLLRNVETEDDVCRKTVVTARHQLYLLKKQLRLERTGLRRGWAEGLAVTSTCRRYPNTVGKALLDRNSKKKDRRVRRPHVLSERIWDHSKAGLTPKRCCQQSRETGRCLSLCLPYSNHCYKHILYNIDQRLFRYCSEQGCELPVLDLGMPQGVPGGALCARHTDRKLWMAPGGGLDSSGSSADLTLAGYKRKATKKYLLLRKHKRRKMKKEEGEEDLRPQTPYEELEESEDGRTSNASSLDGEEYGMPSSSSGTRHTSLGAAGPEGDVSLASVAKDLGFEDHELTEMLNKFPDEAFTSIMSQDFGKNGDHIIRVEDTSSVMDAMVVAAGGSAGPHPLPLPPHTAGGADIPVPPGTHSWADVEQFLLSEGYRGASFAGEMGHFMAPPPPYASSSTAPWAPPSESVVTSSHPPAPNVI